MNRLDSLFVCICLHNCTPHSYVINSSITCRRTLTAVIVKKGGGVRANFFCFPVAPCYFTFYQYAVSTEFQFYRDQCHTRIVHHPEESGADVTPISQSRGFDIWLVIVGN